MFVKGVTGGWSQLGPSLCPASHGTVPQHPLRMSSVRLREWSLELTRAFQIDLGPGLDGQEAMMGSGVPCGSTRNPNPSGLVALLGAAFFQAGEVF